MSEAVLDASAVLAVLKAEVGSSIVEEALPESIISAVNLSEVVAKLAEGGMPEGAIEDALQSVPLRVIPFDEEQAYDMGILRTSTKSAGLSLGDWACLNLARSRGLTAITAERAWPRTEMGVDVSVIR